jgi:methionyl aminopeptidase
MDEHALDCVRKAGRIAGEARELGISLVAPNVPLVKVAEEVEAYIYEKGARLAFPVNLSINDVAAHFSPNLHDEMRFSVGDVVKVDVGAHVDGYIGDTAATVEVGTKNWADLIGASARALTFATEMIADGTPVNAIGGAVERSIKESGFRPVVNLNGHEMKQFNLHAGLSIPNYDDGTTTKVRDGMILAVEPFATNGVGQVDNAKAGNIYRIIRDRQLKDAETMRLFERIKTEFSTLPFCERWCQKLDKDAPHLLKNMFRHGVIMSYPMLREVKHGMVSQTEHTLVIVNNRCEITTKV